MGVASAARRTGDLLLVYITSGFGCFPLIRLFTGRGGALAPGSAVGGRKRCKAFDWDDTWKPSPELPASTVHKISPRLALRFGLLSEYSDEDTSSWCWWTDEGEDTLAVSDTIAVR
jgi:hypothetical protein